MSKILAVAWQEFRQTVFRKVFLLAVLGIPVLMVGAIALAAIIMISHEEPPLIGTVAVVDPSDEVTETARTAFSEASLQEDRAEQIEKMSEDARKAMQGDPTSSQFMTGGTQNVPVRRGEVRVDIESVSDNSEKTIEQLRQRVRNGELLAAAIIPERVLALPDSQENATSTFELYVSPDLDSDHAALIERRLGEAIVNARAARAGIDPAEMRALLDRPVPQTKRVLQTGEATSEGEGVREFRRMIPMAFMMLLWIAVFTAGQHLMMSTIEEKSNRVMEVLLSAASPLQLMTGKIFGHGGVGLLIVSIYGFVAVGALIVFSLFTRFIDVIDLVYLLVFFFMAYFMIAAMFAAVGSAVSDIREANTLITPVMLIVMLPLFLWLPISEAPNGMIAQIFSFIPPAIPFVMILRVTADEPVALWQILTSIAWGYLCVIGMVWLAAKIFRVGVLMYGKPPSPLELIKWVRFS